MPSNRLTRLKRLRLKLEIDSPGKNVARQAAQSATSKTSTRDRPQRASRATFRRDALARAGQKG